MITPDLRWSNYAWAIPVPLAFGENSKTEDQRAHTQHTHTVAEEVAILVFILSESHHNLKLKYQVCKSILSSV